MNLPSYRQIASGIRLKWKALIGASIALFITVQVAAQVAETAFVLNTLAYLVWGAFVMWMCAGFTMLESGSVRTKNASVICMKNIGLYSIAGLMYFLVGYDLMYTGVDGGFWGEFTFFHGSTEAEVQLIVNGADDSEALRGELAASSMSLWFFQMVFVATTASIISGTLAERVNLWAFFAFVAVLTAIIYPIVGAWTWGEGWLYELGFSDFAGSTIVHSTGGWAALAGAILVGGRLGKFREDGSVTPTPPSNVPIVTLGVFILWLGWFGFNGGSVLAMSSTANAVLMGIVLANTNLAAAGGVVMALFLARPILKRLDLLAVLNGAIGGLVAITAAPDTLSHLSAIGIGAVGGAIVVSGMKLLEIVKIDDVVGAIPAHLFAGIWGTIAASFSPNVDFVPQLIGILSIGALVLVSSFTVWWLVDKIIGLRVSEHVESLGQDAAELGIEAYPEFVLMPDPQILDMEATEDQQEDEVEDTT